MSNVPDVRDEHVEAYEDADNLFISLDTYIWLINWMWNPAFLSYYQHHGVEAIPAPILKELRMFRPEKEVYLYRAFESLEKEFNSQRNKLLSYWPSDHMDAATDMAGNMDDSGGYIQIYSCPPELVLVDTTELGDPSALMDIDIMPEVIVINPQG